MARKVLTRVDAVEGGDGSAPPSALAADIIIENAPDPVFVADLDGKILQANEAVSELLGFRQDEVVEQSLSRFISEEETREFTAALREVVERGVTRNARLPPWESAILAALCLCACRADLLERRVHHAIVCSNKLRK